MSRYPVNLPVRLGICALLLGLAMPETAVQAQVYSPTPGVTVDQSVLDDIGRERTVPDLLFPGARPPQSRLLVPPTTSQGYARPSVPKATKSQRSAKPSSVAASREATASELNARELASTSQVVPQTAPAAAAPDENLSRPEPQAPGQEPPPQPVEPAPAPVAEAQAASQTATASEPVSSTPPAPQPTTTPRVEVEAPAPAAAEATPQVATAPAESHTSAPAPAKGQNALTIPFSVGGVEVPSASKTDLDGIAKTLSENGTLTVQISAYASGKDSDPSQARRLSLTRALAVRSYLKEKGILSTRIEVRAMGNRDAGSSPDRVDVSIIGG